MARTDIAAVLDDARDQARGLAATTIDAASVALDTASAQGKELSQRAQKHAKKLADQTATSAKKSAKRADKTARKHANELVATVQEKTGRKPKRRGRKVVVIGAVALAGVAITTVVSKRKAEAAQSEPASDRPSYQ